MDEKFRKINYFKAIKFNYFIRNKCDKNYPLQLSLLFFENFIEKIDDKSPYLEPLILIDSGTYQYNNNTAYGYGLISKELLKSHLKNLIPKIIFVYNDKNISDDIALANKANGAVEINLASNFLSQFNNIANNRDIQDNKLRDNLCLKLVLIFIHEFRPIKREDLLLEMMIS